MKIVAKAVIIDENEMYLLMKRSAHPRFPNDPDLPGGTVEDGENTLDAMMREVDEEAGIRLDPETIAHRYEGDGYSHHHTVYSLYEVRLRRRPAVKISWEHDDYEWVSRDRFLEEARDAADTYMHMVYDVMK